MERQNAKPVIIYTSPMRQKLILSERFKVSVLWDVSH